MIGKVKPQRTGSCYGFKLCANLARLDPSMSVKTADNFALYALVSHPISCALPKDLHIYSGIELALDGWDFASTNKRGNAVKIG